MKLKKILAVALAATTALSSGVAYDALGAGTAKAAASGYFAKDDTFTVTTGGAVYTYTVLIPVADKAKDDGSVDYAKATNLVYSNGKVKAAQNTTTGSVSLTGFSIDDEDLFKLHGTDSDGKVGGYETLYVPNTVGHEDSEDIQHGYYEVDKVELNGNDNDVVKTLDISDVGVWLEVLQAENFTEMNTIKGIVNPYNKLKKILLHGSGLSLKSVVNNTMFWGNVTTNGMISAEAINMSASLEKVDLSGLSDSDTEGSVTFSLFAPGLEEVNLSNDGAIGVIDVETARDRGMKLNISESNNIKGLYVKNRFDEALSKNLGVENAGGASEYDAPFLKGVTFVTNGSDATRDLDLSGLSELKTVKINYAGLKSFSAPSADKGTIDVSHNALTEVNLSAASEASSVNVSYNKLMEIDVNALSGDNLTDLDVSNNYLTALDVASLAKNPNFKNGNNYIPKANFTKADSGQGSLSLKSQNTYYDFAWAYSGDMGQGSGTNKKALIKLGGSGNLIAGIKVLGAPDGFAEKLASTVSFKEANENGGAISLGEATVVSASEMKYTPGVGNLSVVLVSVPVTAAADKVSPEKVTVSFGNATKDITIGNDNVILVNYDISSAISSDNAKDANKDNITQAAFYYPTEAFTLNNSGTVNVSAAQKAYPNYKNYANDLKKIGNGASFNSVYQEAIDPFYMKGLTFAKWNTAADGSGTKVSEKGKLNNVAEDTTLYAQYTENKYTVKFDKMVGGTAPAEDLKVTGSTKSMNGNLYGDNITLTANGYSVKNNGNFYGWAKGNDYLSDGQTTHGLAADKKKSDTATLKAMYGDDNHYISVDQTSIDLTVGGLDDGAYYIGAFDKKVTGAPTISGYANKEIGDVDLDVSDYDIYTSDGGVVEYNSTLKTLVAKGKGTANVYIRDTHYGNVATVSVNVLGKGESKVDISSKIKDLEGGQKVVADGGQTVKLNADGKTVTITKGKNQKTVKINTVTIDGVTYKVTAIAAGAYKGMSKIQTVVIGNNVKTIGKIAFANCKNLKKVTMGKNVQKIGVRCFKNDGKLAKVLIKSKKLTKNSTLGKNSFQKTKSGIKFYIAKKAATFKKIKKVIKAQGGAKKASYVKKYA